MVPWKWPKFYTKPMTQVVLVGITCFATVGMYSAISNLGAGGTQNITLSDTANGVLYGLFAVTGLVSGSISNILGPRLTLFIGTLGYALYVGSLWCYQTQGTSWFLIFAGALLGISAALLWSAQGSIMMSYPLEKDKGKAFSVFWAIFQFGALIGALIAFTINERHGGLTAVSTSTYIAFLVVIFVGIASAFLVLPPNHVIRGDGTIVKLEAASKLHEELLSMWAMRKDWRVLALLPMFFASNYFYAYQGAINTARFDSSTRALNAVLEGAGAIVGALIYGFCVLDAKWMKRRTRGYLGLGVVTVIVIAIWSCGLAWQVTFDRAKAKELEQEQKLINYKDADYRSKGPLFFFCERYCLYCYLWLFGEVDFGWADYFGDACYQALAYWIMSALTNDPFKLARFAGIYKAIQSAGGAGSYGMDAVSTPFLNELLASWIMMLASFPLAFLVLRTVKETNYDDEQMVYVDDVQNRVMEEGAQDAEAGSIAKEEDVTVEKKEAT
ncbi:MFS general substrate transporter [Laetiporus sulphureus 93-53]|uniref:MFS general substrate transporter n=1 Tax=Laetiporus sulphureus 93-53 TaxID=1314785 RepID=A0A165EX34_9APHY|nr:MFS general substrate transporter [Laetiporus sulphureus 93-53]KZT07911.1 MFS general substrate transporter [Laetiporus sulphureus 93-53]